MTENPRKCFGSVDRSDGLKDYAPRSSWSSDLVEVVKGLENLYLVDGYLPMSLRKFGDAPEPTRVYRSPVPEQAGFGLANARGTGWGFADELPSRKF